VELLLVVVVVVVVVVDLELTELRKEKNPDIVLLFVRRAQRPSE
jgi:hypothetical protein